MNDGYENKENLWNEAHDQLKNSMQKEIGIMREILSNMHQEEQSLVKNDRTSWNHVMQERAHLIERLSYLRVERIEATKKIQEMVSTDDKTKKITLEEMLPSRDEATCEILSLRDQLMALVERINFQNCSNEVLYHQMEHHLDCPNQNPYHPLQPIPVKGKKKSSIATYNFKF